MDWIFLIYPVLCLATSCTTSKHKYYIILFSSYLRNFIFFFFSIFTWTFSTFSDQFKKIKKQKYFWNCNNKLEKINLQCNIKSFTEWQIVKKHFFFFFTKKWNKIERNNNYNDSDPFDARAYAINFKITNCEHFLMKKKKKIMIMDYIFGAIHKNFSFLHISFQTLVFLLDFIKNGTGHTS